VNNNSFGIGSNNKLLLSGIVLSTVKVTAPFPEVKVVICPVNAVNLST
jgi:hypothetical protein